MTIELTVPPTNGHPAGTAASQPRVALPGRDDISECDDKLRGPASVSKALTLLDCFRDATNPLGVSELARRASLPKSTAFRLLSYLEEAGYVERVGKHYRVGWKLFELGNRVGYCRPGRLRDIATPYLTELFAQTHYVVHLAVLDGTDVVYLEKIHGHQAPPTPTRVGGRMPASCCALGKAILSRSPAEKVREVLLGGLRRRTPYSLAEPGRLLADLSRVRTRSVAFDREEAALGLTCVGAPILRDEVAVAAISVSGPTTRFDPAVIAPAVQQAASRIGFDLRFDRSAR